LTSRGLVIGLATHSPTSSHVDVNKLGSAVHVIPKNGRFATRLIEVPAVTIADLDEAKLRMLRLLN
jgi:hypothetical protein